MNKTTLYLVAVLCSDLMLDGYSKDVCSMNNNELKNCGHPEAYNKKKRAQWYQKPKSLSFFSDVFVFIGNLLEEMCLCSLINFHLLSLLLCQELPVMY